MMLKRWKISYVIHTPINRPNIRSTVIIGFTEDRTQNHLHALIHVILLTANSSKSLNRNRDTLRGVFQGFGYSWLIAEEQPTKAGRLIFEKFHVDAFDFCFLVSSFHHKLSYNKHTLILIIKSLTRN